MKIASGTIAAVIVLAVISWTMIPERVSFAQAVKAINEAQTITWTTTYYSRFSSKDGDRDWVDQHRVTEAYRHPGLYRETHYDDGNVARVTITDSRSGKSLQLDMNRKQAIVNGEASRQNPDPRGPFAWVADVLDEKPLELVGQRQMNGRTVSVIRYRQDKNRIKHDSVDIWIDAESKELVGCSHPGADYFDPTTATVSEENVAGSSKGGFLGFTTDEIVFDANLDAGSFSLIPPDGFEVVTRSRPTATEEDLVQWLRAVARYNDDTFPDSLSPTSGIPAQRFQASNKKNKDDQTDAERKLIDLFDKYMRAGLSSMPISPFIRDKTADGSFQYLGKGVKLGESNRIVCWYKLKSTGTYRAVFGDLTVKDVEAKDLPLSVEQ